ncbi:MAG: sulfotransferase domain-containing protein [Phycisphaerales bacterium]|jgi:hypothetical protein
MEPPTPTAFHITHWKAGSQWIRKILNRLEPDRIADEPGVPFLDSLTITPGHIYTPVYLPRYGFVEAAGTDPSYKCAVFIRDLRDAMVSWYFSMRHSHPLNPSVVEFREKLNSVSLEDGLLFALEKPVAVMARCQQTWHEAAADERKIVRYEDAIADQQAVLGDMLKYLGVGRDDAHRRQAIEAESFERTTGRKPGQEDVGHHNRKGTSGDWKNHFTDRVTDAFKQHHGQLLITLGYEQDLDW